MTDTNLAMFNEAKRIREAHNRLAKALAIEYEDFMDGKDVPMTIALGENMRSQLAQVFKILEREGIRFQN